MFGYVRINEPFLRVWESELYKSIYCGLCCHGGKRTTRLTRFLLSYDFVALAIVRMALLDEKVKLKKRFCPYCPKRKVMIEPNDSLDFTADAFIILAYYKLCDDKNDSKGIKHFFASASPLLLKKEFKKAEKRCPGLGEKIQIELQRLAEKESNNESSIDSVADCFGILLAETLSFGIEEKKHRIAYEIGYHVGRYIYIIDALDDFKKDLKHNNYNPLVIKYQNIETLKNNVDSIAQTLRASAQRVNSAINLIENDEYKGIIENIFIYGCNSIIGKTVDEILK